MNPMVIMQMIQSLPPQMKHMLIQALASQGVGGDTAMAHLTPGEIAVPPEVQTPKVLATLNKAFTQKHVSPQQFQVGNPASSINPKTGAPQYNFLSAFLPAAMGIAGSFAAPYLAPELLGAGALSAPAASAIGGGLGTTIGGLAAGQSPTQAALSGIGSGAGGYMLGNIGNGLTASGDPTRASMLRDAGIAPGAASQSASSAADLTGGFPQASPSSPGMSMFGQKINPLGMAGSALGGYVGGQLGAPPKPVQPNYPPGFNTPMTPLGSLHSAQTQLGQNTSKQPMPSFSGFNPMTNYPGAYNFFPTATSGG